MTGRMLALDGSMPRAEIELIAIELAAQHPTTSATAFEVTDTTSDRRGQARRTVAHAKALAHQRHRIDRRPVLLTAGRV